MWSQIQNHRQLNLSDMDARLRDSCIFNCGMQIRNNSVIRFYSYLNESDGFLFAAFTAVIPEVATTMINEIASETSVNQMGT